MNGSRNGTSPKLGRYEAGAEPIAAPDGARRNGASARASDPVHAWSGSRTQRFLRLLYPGIGLKRWALVGALGVAACSIGVSFLISHLLAVSFPSVLPWYSRRLFAARFRRRRDTAIHVRLLSRACAPVALAVHRRRCRYGVQPLVARTRSRRSSLSAAAPDCPCCCAACGRVPTT